LRLEIGPKDLAKNSTRVIRRDNGEATFISLDQLGKSISDLLVKIQSDMFERAKQERDSRLVRLETWDNFVSTLDKKCMILAPWCETVTCEEAVKERSARS
jgi:prolyl-tRNA synthetase